MSQHFAWRLGGGTTTKIGSRIRALKPHTTGKLITALCPGQGCCDKNGLGETKGELREGEKQQRFAAVTENQT